MTRKPHVRQGSREIWVQERILTYPDYVVRLYKEDLGRRIAESRKLLGHKVVLVDPHMHTRFSDGIGTVAQMKEAADRIGLDAVFVTDHDSIRQKSHCARYDRVWWGQEPVVAERHHMCLLLNNKRFNPQAVTLAEDYATALSLSPFAFITHPGGWWPSTYYESEQKHALYTLPRRMAMEVLNAANKMISAYDKYDADAVRTWNELLNDGREVTAIGSSDAHLPWGVGSAWTGVYAASVNRHSVVRAMRAGHTFASEAPLIWIGQKGNMIGTETAMKKKQAIRIPFVVCDAGGLDSVRVIRNGRIVKTIAAKDEATIRGEYRDTFGGGRKWYRVECTASDQRRAFSSPIYITERQTTS